LSTNPLAVIHQYLIEQEFKRSNAPDSYSYEGTLIIDGVSFIIEIVIVCPDFITIPIVRVTHWPEKTALKKPHIETTGNLCYLDPLSFTFDRYSPVNNIQYTLKAVETLLKSYIDKNTSGLKYQYAAEFTSYWHGKYHFFIRSKGKGSLLAIYSDAERKKVEYVVYSNEEQLAHWMNNSVLKDVSIVNKVIPVIFVGLTNPPLIYSDSKWPPKSTKDYLNWLSRVDKNALKILMTRLSKSLKVNKQVVIITLTESGHIAIQLNYSDHQLMGRLNSILKEKRNRLRHFLSQNFALSKERFTRCKVIDVSDERIVTRNLPDKTKSLIGKKIVLLGCGTIGGFTALLLTQVGAGLKNAKGIGQLDIVDGDNFSSDNIGRHLLDIKAIGKNKALAIKDHLDNRSFSERLNITAIPSNLSIQTFKKLSYYDLIIDATGVEEFSNSINHQHFKDDFNTPILHAWLELSGKAARAIFVDKIGACYRCLRKINNEQRIPLINSKTAIPESISRECGNSYYPYSSSSSAASAAMIQKMVLDFFMGNPSPRFRHMSLSDDVRNAKSSNLNKLSGCPCCNNI
jgi:molybdopterin/thiamine biosynthesis adenylyltransferase